MRGVDGPLNEAADHGVAAYEAIEATGLRHLIQPAKALLMALGREIARGLSRIANDRTDSTGAPL